MVKKRILIRNMFWDDAESDEKVKKSKKEVEAEEGESIDDYQSERPNEGTKKERPNEGRKKTTEKEDAPNKDGPDSVPQKGVNVPEEVPRDREIPKDVSKNVPSGGAPKNVPDGGAPKNVPDGGAPNNVPGGGAPKNVPSGGAPKNVPSGGASNNVPGGEVPNKESIEDNNKNEPSNEDPNKIKNGKDDDKDGDTKTIFTDKDQEENPEYKFIPTSKKEEEPKGDFIYGVLRIVASAPVIVSFFSLSHIIRKIPVKYLMIGSALAPIHFILSLFMISDISKDDSSKDVAYTSLTTNSCPPLSIIVDVYLFVMKFLTCIFMVDMFLETIYAVFPDFRLDEFSFGFAKIFLLLLISLFLVTLILTYKSLPIALHGLNIALIVAAVVFLICIAFFSKLNVRRFANVSNNNSQIYLSDILFLGFSFISFACECQSVSVMVFKKNKSGSLAVSIVSVLSILFFLFLLFYFGDWILQKSLSETLNIILPSYSDFNRSLKDSKSDSFNLLSRISFLSCLVISLIGFVLQMNILSRSLISIFTFLRRASDIVGFIVTFSLVLSLVILVVLKDIGRILWIITRVIFFGFPFYAMYPYLAELTNEKANKVMFVLSIVVLLSLCFFVYLSFYDVSILKPSNL